MRDAGYWTMIGVVFSAFIGAIVALFQTLKNSRDVARTTELNELREFRKELREEIGQLRTRVNNVESELHEAQGQLIKQREFFVGILYKLEGIMTLKDAVMMAGQLQRLVESVREFLDVMPIGSLEAGHRTNILEQEP